MKADLSKRVGCLAGGIGDIKGHPWFKGVDWSIVLNREYEPPIRWNLQKRVYQDHQIYYPKNILSASEAHKNIERKRSLCTHSISQAMKSLMFGINYFLTIMHVMLAYHLYFAVYGYNVRSICLIDTNVNFVSFNKITVKCKNCLVASGL